MQAAGAAALALAVVLGAFESRAAKNVTSFEIRYTPTEILAPVDLPGEWRSRPLVFEVRDGRSSAPEFVGSRTDDDDRPYELKALNDVRQFVDGTLSDMLGRWGLSLATLPGEPETAPNPNSGKLTLQLTSFRVIETNQAVGATYEAQVQLIGELSAPGTAVPVQATGDGEATRYGKKFSNLNCNEVLSDALANAAHAFFDNLVQHYERLVEGDDALQAGARSGAGPAVTTPEHLLAEIKEIKAAGVGEGVLVDFIDNWTLTRPLSGSEVLEFREVLGSDSLLQVVLRRPIATGPSNEAN